MQRLVTSRTGHRLTPEEVRAARPLRAKVIAVQPGGTVEPLSHRMAGVDRPIPGYARVATHDHRFQRGTTLEQQRGQQEHSWL
jgi:predicted Zn-dependent protease